MSENGLKLATKQKTDRDRKIDRMFLDELEKAKETVSVASKELSTQLQAVFTS